MGWAALRTPVLKRLSARAARGTYQVVYIGFFGMASSFASIKLDDRPTNPESGQGLWLAILARSAKQNAVVKLFFDRL
jgi:hypothetical protein